MTRPSAGRAGSDKVQSIFSLSPVQEGMLIHAISEGGGTYLEQVCAPVPGDTDAEALARAWQQLHDRHAALRTALLWERRERPSQVVLKSVEASFNLVDLRASADADMELANLVENDGVQAFDLHRAPLARLTLARVSDDAALLVCTLSHLVIDGWSFGLLLKELFDFYNGHAPVERAPAFEEFVRYIQQRDPTVAQDFWRKYLDDVASPTLLLPVLRRPNAGTGPRKRVVIHSVTSDSRIRETLNERRVTPTALVATAIGQEVARYCRRSQALLGLTLSTRPSAIANAESMVGPLINTLPLKVEASNDQLQETQARITGLLEYSDSSLSAVQAVSHIHAETLFDAILVFENYPVPTIPSPNSARFERYSSRNSVGSHYAFTFVASLRDEGELSLSLAYDPSIVLTRSAELLLDRVSARVRQLLFREPRRDAGPPEPSATYDALHTKLSDDNLSTRFRAIAGRYPDRSAIRFQGESVTYRELDSASDQLAATFQACGVRPGDVVAFQLPPSVDMCRTMLAIVKAGATYLPIDAETPTERRDEMLRDAGVSLLVSEDDQAPSGVNVLRPAATGAGQFSSPNIPATSVAYIIFTSGSLGRPKGVMITHRNAVRLFDACQPLFEYDESDVWSVFHSIAFDFSVWELWGPWLSGGCAVVVPKDVVRDPEQTWQLLQQERVSVLSQTPSAFSRIVNLARELTLPPLPALKFVVFGGEALEAPALESWVSQYGDTQPKLINMYGITETTVHVTFAHVARRNDRIEAALGRPLPDLALRLSNDGVTACMADVPGEILVGGAGVASGYLRRPGLTADRFRPDPWSEHPGARLYRSGDLAVLRTDESLAYLGRIDAQVKVRGYRIELGEIQVVATQHPSTREAVALVERPANGSPQLALAVVPKDGSAFSIAQLQAHMQGRLPHYMVPGRIFVVETVPLNKNGKVDRNALLRLLSSAEHRVSDAYSEPRTSTEFILSAIFAKVLRRTRVGIDDNFFALGGDSIRTISIQGLAAKAGLRFKIQDIYENPTIRQLGKLLSHDLVDAAPTAAFELLSDADRGRVPAGVEDVYPLASVQAGLLYEAQLSTDYRTYINCFHFPATFEIRTLLDGVQALSSRHEVLRTTYDMTTYSEAMQVVHPQSKVSVQIVDLTALQPLDQQTTAERWIAEEQTHHFDVQGTGLVRLTAMRRSDDSSYIALSEPFFDGWSVTNVVSELAMLLFRGVPPTKSALECGYRDYVKLERETISSEVSREFWRQRAAEMGTTALPPLDGTPDSDRVLGCKGKIGPKLDRKLRDLALRAGVPVKAVCMAAHMRVLSMLLGRTRVTTGVTFNGRPERTDGERLVGSFLNVLPLTLDVRGSWLDLIRDCFRAETELLPHRRYPMPELRRRYAIDHIDTTCNFTHFHQYRSLVADEGLRPIQIWSNDQYYIPLVTQWSMDATTGQLLLAFDARGRDLSEAWLDRIKGYFERVLDAMVRDPDASCAYWCPLSPEELRFVEEINTTSTPVPQGDFLSRLAAHAESTPDAVACIDDVGSRTYRELEAQSDALGRALRAIRPRERDYVVPLLLNRSGWMSVALFGCFKAGGAYLPLDPTHPPERLKHILKLSGATVLVHDDANADLAKQLGCALQHVDATGETHAPDGGVTSIDPEQMIYVIYTSGSTGEPKGVMNTHEAVWNSQIWLSELLGATRYDVFLQKTPYTFDVSVDELLVPFMLGARLVYATPGRHTEPAHLRDRMNEFGVTIAHFVPSILAAFVAEVSLKELPSLKQIACNGEAFPQALQDRILEEVPDMRLFNLYGPTEAAIKVSYWQCKLKSQYGVPIGSPISNLTLQVLDEELVPVAPGVVGDLYIAGVGLARGYLGRPDLTADVFVPDPSRDGERMYRTNDLARVLPNGAIEYRGRADRQVKLRGMRLELGEIEGAACSTAGVRQAAVVIHAGELVGYYVGDDSVTVEQLATAMRETLPSAYVPTRWIRLKELPTNTSGKTDYRRLPAPHRERKQGAAPRDDTERMVARVFSEVLDVEDIGIDESFFELGGHSLLVTRAAFRIERETGVRLPLGEMLKSPTVETAAALINKLRATPSDTASKIKPRVRRRVRLPKDSEGGEGAPS